METRPKDLNEVWTEKELCEKLGIPVNPNTGRSRSLAHWVRGGLPYVEKSGRRFFSEQDVITYLCQPRNEV